jgi:hypothetical protein
MRRSRTPASPSAVLDAPVLSVAGLPLHPLVIHAVVVLLPLAAIGTLAMAVRPVWRRNLGVPTLLVALTGTIAVPVATVSGQQLQATQGGGSPLVAEHAARAGALLPVALLFLVLLAAAVVVERTALSPNPAGRTARSPDGGEPARTPALLTAAAAVAGAAVTGLVVWIGHAGASAVWSGVV